jgi:CubicO group peptidase (beta-lactamase class C family)
MKLAGLAAVLLAMTSAAQAGAQDRDFAPEPLTRENVAAWAERTLGGAVEAGRITGAVVSVVRDGEVLLEQGYGLGDIVERTPADPVATRVRIGSTTKTFTATLVAQLMQEGLITGLDDPANLYLERYSLPENNGRPITLRHLLTHTAGFEDRFFFIGSDRPVDIPVAPGLFDSLRPPFARPVDDRVVYSNFGVASLGPLIEDQTGQAIDTVMEERLFGPLGMTQTDLVVSIGEPEDLARPGLLDADGPIGPVPFTAINPAVAQTGSIVSTAHDMALYMNAQLGHGDLLGAAARRRLHTRITGNHPDLSGIGMVFFIDEWAGERVVSHGGNWAGFHTWMTLLPGQDTGLFVTLLSDAPPRDFGERFTAALRPGDAPAPSPALLSASSIANGFLAAFLGEKRALAEPGPAALNELDRYAGLYRGDRRPFSTVEELSSLVFFGGEVLEVAARSDGLYLGNAGPWLPQGGGRFVLDVPTRPMMVIQSHPRTGTLTLTPDIGIYTFSRIPGWAHPKWHALALCLLLPAIGILGLTAPLTGRSAPRLASGLTAGVSALAIILIAFAGLEPGANLMSGYYAGHPQRLIGIWLFGNLLLASSTAALALAVLRHEPLPARLHLAATGGAALIAGLVMAFYGGAGLPRF